jgi:peptide-methionine (S)-S-oxide reductase
MTSPTERAVLAGGCFWGMQDLLRRYPGVVSTRVGYSGGDVPNATYRNHGSHAEAIEIVFDPKQISYRKLLEFFFQIHDPTTRNRQGNDIGPSYRSAIYYTSEEQKRTAEETIADVNASGLWPGKVVTESLLRGRSGRRSPNTRTIWNATRWDTPATSFDPTGCCQSADRRSPKAVTQAEPRRYLPPCLDDAQRRPSRRLANPRSTSHERVVDLLRM